MTGLRGRESAPGPAHHPPRAAIMPAQTARKPTLIDGMILVAAVALGLAGIRAERTKHFHPAMSWAEMPQGGALGMADPTYSLMSTNPISIPVVGPSRFANWHRAAQEWAESARLAAPCLAALSPAMLLIRLRHPRPPWHRLVRQAGWAASLGATLALGVGGIRTVLKLRLGFSGPMISIPGQAPMQSRLGWVACQTIHPHLIGMVVLCAWVALAAGGRRRERGWIDRGGVAVGCGWVAMLPLGLFLDEPV